MPALALNEPQTEANAAPVSATLECPAVFVHFAPQTANADTLLQGLRELSAIVEACDLRADFHAHRGALLLSAGQAQEAANSLEKALMLDPNLAGAQIDFAQALSRIGQRQPAQDLVNQVTQRVDIEPQLKVWLQESLRVSKADARNSSEKRIFRARLGEPVAREGQWSWAGRIQTVFGRESNLSGASHTTDLPLYLDSGIVYVALADTELPQSGSATKLIALIDGVRAVASGKLRWTAAVQGRHASHQTAAKNQSVDSRVTYSEVALAGIVSGTLGWSQFLQGTNNRYRDYSYRIEYQPDGHIFGCTAATHIGRTIQRHSANSASNGQEAQIGLEVGCSATSQGIFARGSQTVIGVNTGRNSPQSLDRPGGLKTRIQVSIQHQIPLNWSQSNTPGILSFSGRWNDVRDQRIISSLFGPEPTQTQRAEFGISYWHPLGNEWSAGIEFDRSLQRSNNALLDVKNRSIYTGLRWSF